MKPFVIVDKSVLQMLNKLEVAELSECFDLIAVPTLFREIIADLRKPATTGRRLPQDVIRTLAECMCSMHTATPINFRKAAISNLNGETVPMNGVIPVDADATNVHVSKNGRQLVYDSTLEQQLWHRWRDGNFSTNDTVVASAWRAGLDRVNLKALGNGWRAFVNENIGKCTTIDEVVEKVDRILSMPILELQARGIAVLLVFLRADADVASRFAFIATIDPRTTLGSYAPYAASILRLYLTFVSAVSYGLITLRPSNYIDLQYLFYAPFSMGFASNDRFHKQLWSAASGSAIFIQGQQLKNDLSERAAWRASLSNQELEDHYSRLGSYG
jgi:hypothetical protein